MTGKQDFTPRKKLVERNEDGSLTRETVKRAMKAFRKRLKLMRLDDESRLTHILTTGVKSTIIGIRPPDQYPSEVWVELVETGRLRLAEPGVYEIVAV